MNALRNEAWITHAIHSTDFSERLFRIIIEILLILLCFNFVITRGPLKADILGSLVLSIFASHTIMWLLDGNFWVYMLDSFNWVKNPGINRILSYVRMCRRIFQVADMCNAILIYGSMCRSEFHNRSDLDLRVIRRTDSWLGILCLPMGFFLRVLSFFIMLPLDLQVADSMTFLRKQMRKDEFPIVVFLREGFKLQPSGKNFTEIEKNPSTVLKKAKAQ